jgi:hypothetical protein
MIFKLSGSYRTQHEAAMGGFLFSMTANRNKVAEFAFWVIFDLTVKGSPVFKYTEPQTDGSPHGVKLTSPTLSLKQSVTAFCHTHPGSLTDANFSSDDLGEFNRLQNFFPGISFYLLTPQNLIRLAQNVEEFKPWNVKSVEWNSSIKP